jgi:hypothetical protein
MKRLVLTFSLSILVVIAHAQWVRTGGPTCTNQLGEILLITDADGMRTLLVPTNHGISRSTDLGRTWIADQSSLRDSAIGAVLMWREQLVVSTQSYPGRVLISSDRGISWRQLGPDFDLDVITSLAAFGESFVVGTFSRGVFALTLNGKTWQTVNKGLGFDMLEYFNDSTCHVENLWSDGSTLYVKVNHTTECSSTTDLSDHWTALGPMDDEGKLIGSGSRLKFRVVAQRRLEKGLDGYVQTVWGDSCGLAWTDRGAFVSTDDGSTWNLAECRSPLFSRMGGVRSLVRVNDTIVVSTEELGILRSTDRGSHWVESSDGLHKITWGGMSLRQRLSGAGAALWGESPYGLARSTDEGEHWEELPHNADLEPKVGFVPSSWNEFEYASDSTGIVVATENRIFHCRADGSAWTLVYSQLDSSYRAKLKGIFISDGTIFVTRGFDCERAPLVSSDAGVHWRHIAPFFKSPVERPEISGGYRMPQLVNDFVALDSTFLAATSYGLKISRDGGKTWKTQDNEYEFHALTAVGPCIFALRDHIFSRSTDKGKTWTRPGRERGKGKKKRMVQFTIVKDLFASHGLMFAATDSGFFGSDNKGESWLKLNNGLPVPNIDHIAATDQYVFWVSEEGEIWRRSFENIWTAINKGGD